MEHTNMLCYDQRILKLPDVVKLKTAIIMFKAFHNAYMSTLRHSYGDSVNLTSLKTSVPETKISVI